MGFDRLKKYIFRRQQMTPSEQGKKWRQAGGLFHDCWYREGTTERLLWEKGWKEEDARLSDSKRT